MPVWKSALSVAWYLVPPLMVVWGWTRWAARPRLRTLASNSSLLGFILATASAVLAISSIAYAQVHHFPYYDPLLLRIFAWGALLSIAGIGFGIGGVLQANSLRLHPTVSAACMLVFLIVSTSGER